MCGGVGLERERVYGYECESLKEHARRVWLCVWVLARQRVYVCGGGGAREREGVWLCV